MSKLYTELSNIYEAMYATFIDYNEEYKFYSQIIKDQQKESVLEIGSGTGNLAKLFTDNGFVYQGLDFSEDMLEIAKQKHPNCIFKKGDMRDFNLEAPVESVIITGRSTSYLLKNEDINATFRSIHKNLKPEGVLCFDFIDANRFIPQIKHGDPIIHKASLGDEHYSRESIWRLNLAYGMDLIWDAKYSKTVGTESEEIGTDSEVVRTFTKNELELFLDINQFQILNIIDRQTYAFPTYVILAQKKS